jgi:hypothetical protein
MLRPIFSGKIPCLCDFALAYYSKSQFYLGAWVEDATLTLRVGRIEFTLARQRS